MVKDSSPPCMCTPESRNAASRRHEEHCADVINAALLKLRLFLLTECRHTSLDGQQTDGEHGQEHQSPAEKLEEDSEDHKSDQRARPRAGNRKGIGPAPLIGREGEGKHGVAVAVNQTRAESLQAAEDNNLFQVLRDRDEDCADSDDDGANQEDLGMTEPVSQASAQKDGAAQDKQVGDYYPGCVVDGCLENAGRCWGGPE